MKKIIRKLFNDLCEAAGTAMAFSVLLLGLLVVVFTVVIIVVGIVERITYSDADFSEKIMRHDPQVKQIIEIKSDWSKPARATTILEDGTTRVYCLTSFLDKDDVYDCGRKQDSVSDLWDPLDPAFR